MDVTVHHNGETLSSAEDSRNISTAFGILSFEGEEDEKKILRLREGENYEICINGTGNGTMDYTISYPDENGDYTDERCFRDIPITKDTVIVTTTENAGFTRMDQDTDGNGTFDQSYAAAKGTEGIEVMKILTVVAAVITILLILLIIIFKIRRMLKRRKEGKYCPNCGAPIDGKIQFCGVCGRQIQNNVSIKKSQPKWIRNLKLAVIAAGIIICVGITALQRSAAMTVLQQLKKNQIVSAQMIYENSVKDSKISQKYLTLLLEHYMDQIMESFGTGAVSKEAAEEIYLVIEEMNIEDVSSTAGEYIESMNVLKNIEEAEE